MFLVGQVSWLVENFNIGIYSDSTNVTNVKLRLLVSLIELYQFISFSVTLTIFQGHCNVELFLQKHLCSYPVRLKLCSIVS